VRSPVTVTLLDWPFRSAFRKFQFTTSTPLFVPVGAGAHERHARGQRVRFHDHGARRSGSGRRLVTEIVVGQINLTAGKNSCRADFSNRPDLPPASTVVTTAGGWWLFCRIFGSLVGLPPLARLVKLTLVTGGWSQSRFKFVAAPERPSVPRFGPDELAAIECRACRRADKTVTAAGQNYL